MIPKLPSGFTQPVFIDGGGFARVYRAHQKALDRFVAIKIIQEQDASKRGTILQEATTQAHLKIDCVPQIYDAFEKNAQVFIIMQFVFGTSLADVLMLSLSQEQRFTIAQHLIIALAKLHSHGYAHRDLKPNNILISPELGVFLIDFGFTKNVFTGDKSVEEYVKGTPAYMAPELWRLGPNVDLLKVDLYALGLIVKDILGGYIPEVIRTCINENPAMRPEHAGAVLALWQTQVPTQFGHPRWESMTEPAASQKLAQRLFEAASDLIQVQRHDEAYWLLDECLKMHPDMPEAFELMRNFPRFAQKKKHRQVLIGSALVLGLILLISGTLFFRIKTIDTIREALGKDTQPSQTIELTQLTVAEKQTVAAKTTRANATVLQEGQQETFTGDIMITDFPETGSLYINNEIKMVSQYAKNQFTLASGTYTLVWKDPNNIATWREQVTLLPFQTLALCIRNR